MQEPNSGLGRFLSRFLAHTQSHTHTHTHKRARAVGLLWKSDQLAAEAATYTICNKHNRRTSLSSVEFEPTIPAIERPPGIGNSYLYQQQNVTLLNEGTTEICWTFSSQARCSKQNWQSLLSHCIIYSSTALLALFIGAHLFYFLWRIYYVSTDSAYIQ